MLHDKRFPCDMPRLKGLLHLRGSNLRIACFEMGRSHAYISEQVREYGSVNVEIRMFLENKYGITPDMYAPDAPVLRELPSKRVFLVNTWDIESAVYKALEKAKEEGIL